MILNRQWTRIRQLYVLLAPKCKSWNLPRPPLSGLKFSNRALKTWFLGFGVCDASSRYWLPIEMILDPQGFFETASILHLKADQNKTILWKRIKGNRQVTNDFVWKTAHSRDNSSNKLVLKASDSFKNYSTQMNRKFSRRSWVGTGSKVRIKTIKHHYTPENDTMPTEHGDHLGIIHCHVSFFNGCILYIFWSKIQINFQRWMNPQHP